jgi:small GTP-binding protein
MISYNKMDNKLLFRVLLVGGSNVGKTCIMLKYVHNFFLAEYVPTIVVDCTSKSTLVQGKSIKICIFDSPGSEEFGTLTPAYWHLADIIIFVAAIKQRDSFESIKKMETEIFEVAESNARKVVFLNKYDLVGQERSREDHDLEEEVRIWADQRKLDFFTCSAKEETSVTSTIVKVIDLDSKDKNKKLEDEKTANKKRCKCEVF